MADRPVHTMTASEGAQFIIASVLTDDITGYSCAATVRRLLGGRNSYTPLAAIVVSPTITTFVGDAERGDGFYVSIPDDSTLKPGIYQVDAEISVSGDVAETFEWLLEVQA